MNVTIRRIKVKRHGIQPISQEEELFEAEVVEQTKATYTLRIPSAKGTTRPVRFSKKTGCRLDLGKWDAIDYETWHLKDYGNKNV